MNTILKDFLNSEIFPQMKKLGFRKCGGYFYRQNEHFAYTIHIEKPACAVYQDEFIIGAGIFSFDIADIIGYNSDRRIIKDLHGDHYSLIHKDIINLGEEGSISIGDYEICTLGRHIRKALENLNEFFKSIEDIDTFLELLLENGCGRQRFFSNMVVRYALLTRRWEYAEKLISKEKERREDWDFPSLLAEKYKELCEGDTGHRAFEVSWDKSLLRNRAMSQGIKIQTKEWDDFILKYTRTDRLYQENQDWIFNNIPDNIEGQLDYNDDSWDFIQAYYIRSGLVAAVSGRIKTILEESSVSKDEYVLIPIRIKETEEPYYLLFIHSIGHSEIDFTASLYDTHRKFSSVSEFREDPDSHSIAYPVIPQKYAGRDLIYIENGKETYMSARLIKAFREANIKGISFSAIGTLRFSKH